MIEENRGRKGKEGEVNEEEKEGYKTTVKERNVGVVEG